MSHNVPMSCVNNSTVALEEVKNEWAWVDCWVLMDEWWTVDGRLMDERWTVDGFSRWRTFFYYRHNFFSTCNDNPNYTFPGPQYYFLTHYSHEKSKFENRTFFILAAHRNYRRLWGNTIFPCHSATLVFDKETTVFISAAFLTSKPTALAKKLEGDVPSSKTITVLIVQ